MVTFNDEQQKRRLEELRLQEEENLVKILAKKYGIASLDLSVMSIDTDALRLIPEETARAAGIAAFKLTGKKIDVAVIAPQKEATVMAAKELAERGYEPTVYMVSRRSMERAWERYKELSYAHAAEAGVLSVSSEKVQEYLKTLSTLAAIKTEVEKFLAGGKTRSISELLEILLAGGIGAEASDIHVEPEEKDIIIRLRLDGVLEELTKIEAKTYTLLVSRIKLLSGLKLNIKTEAQDGRFSIRIDDTEIEIRTSVVPGSYGESVVMRLLNPKTIRVPLDELGIEPGLLATLQEEIKKPNGMLLNTGPTGSGKTTTLYAFLRKVQTPHNKIITIEDPIEYHLAGITQTQTNVEKGYTFARGLRAALRQDPDIIMVGEIRDKETAATAIHASLTGHFVLSTLHTNNAAGAIPRLIDLGVNPKIITSAVNVAMAQRLLRRLKKDCVKEVVLAGKDKDIVEKILESIVDKSKIPQNTTRVWEPSVGGACETGFKGRIGIFEAIFMDEKIEYLTKENPSEREIKKAARSQAMLTMQQDGIIKVLNGVTSLDELRRTVDLEEDIDI